MSDDALIAKAAEAIRLSNTLSGPWMPDAIDTLAKAVIAAVRDQIAAEALRDVEQAIADRYERIYRPATATRAAFATIRDLILTRADRLDPKEGERG